MALLILRTTPIDHKIPAPCVLLNNRNYRSNLPFCQDRAQLSYGTALQTRQDKQKFFHDRKGARELPPLCPGDHVRMFDHKKRFWVPAEVIRHADSPRSYEVKCMNGGVYRRNRVHLRNTQEKHQRESDAEDDAVEMSPPAKTVQQEEPTRQNPPEVRRSARVRTSTEMTKYKDFVKK